ncbi:unnamed protein product [Paramecium primaurelia]|uniref:Uncharacterized protein n=1 Tax=Paramecium primaurelia TaxID=5886 RepID=A0A8S1QT16_PARPR|nr:unnamed protein product [Paramecium primaurelia]
MEQYQLIVNGEIQKFLNQIIYMVMVIKQDQFYFSSDKNTLASGSADKSIGLWDVKTGQQKAKLKIHRGSAWSVCFSPNGKVLASGDGNGSVILWDTKTRKKRAKLDGHRKTVYSVCFSPDGKTLASGSDIPQTDRLIITPRSQCISIRRETE